MATSSNSTSIPAAQLVQDPNPTKLVIILLGVFYFLVLILLDAFTAIAGKPQVHWVPGKALILSSLSISILTFLDYKSMDITSVDKWEREATSDIHQRPGQTHLMVRRVISHLLISGSGRLVICVFIGYLLPEMARPGSVTNWRNIVALVINLFNAVISEFFYTPQLLALLHKIRIGDEEKKVSQFMVEDGHTIAKMVRESTLVLFVSISFLLLLLVSAIIAGRTVRGLLSERISLILKKSESSWEKFEEKIVTSWLLSFLGQPQYLVARSVLTSSVGLVVTGFIVFSLAQGFKLRSLRVFKRYARFHLIWKITFLLQCVFVVVGWIVILWRWFTSLFYFSKDFSWSSLRVEYYWTRSIFEQVYMYDLHRWRLKEEIQSGGISSRIMFSGLVFRVATALKLHKLLHLIAGVQMAAVFFSNVCWFVSYAIFTMLGLKFFATRLFRNDKFILDFRSGEISHGYEEFREALQCLCIQRENPRGLWLANETSMKRAKTHMTEGKEEAGKCGDLVALITHRFHPQQLDRRFVDQLEPLHLQPDKCHFMALDECWKIVAISLLNIIIQLLPFYDDKCRVKEAIEAYKQAWDLMTFVENSHVENLNTIDLFKVLTNETDRVSIVAYQELQRLLKLYDEIINNKSTKSTNVESAIKDIIELSEKAENLIKSHGLVTMKIQQSSQAGFDIIDGEEGKHCRYCEAHYVNEHRNELALSLCMYKVCNLILNRSYGNVKELVDFLQTSLGDVIADCLLRLPEVLVKSCRDWAIEFEEDKIWDAIYIAGKVKGIKEKCEQGQECHETQLGGV